MICHKTSRSVLFVLISVMIIGFFLTNGLFVENSDHSTNYKSSELRSSNSIILKNITIDDSETGLGAHNWSWAVEQSWCSGNGTYSNPYTIQNITFDGNITSNGLIIKNSIKNFIIRNCSFRNSKSGFFASIKLLNVTNGFFTNNSFNDNDQGIYIKNSFNLTIYDNSFEGNSANSFNLIHSNNISIINNQLRFGVYGILLNNNSDLNNITLNYIEGTLIAISILNHSDYNLIEKNELINNNKCFYEDDDCVGNKFINNNCNKETGDFFTVIIYILMFAILFAIPTVLINKYIRKRQVEKEKKEREEESIFRI